MTYLTCQGFVYVQNLNFRPPPSQKYMQKEKKPQDKEFMGSKLEASNTEINLFPLNPKFKG